MKLTPRLLKLILNIYGPFLGAGIKVEHISSDWRNIRVSMDLHWYNRNAVGVHFGGSLYSMVDPHLMLMYMQLLGKDYIVWDKAATINFLRPGKGKVYKPSRTIEIKDSQGDIVAKVKKDLYIRRKKSH